MNPAYNYLDIASLVDSFSDVLRVRIFIDSPDPALRSLYINHINFHNYSLLNESNKEPHNRHVTSGFDLYNPSVSSFTPYHTNTIDFQVKCNAFLYTNDNNKLRVKNSGFYMYPRASLGKTDLRLANNIGIINSGYRGNLIGLFDYVGNSMEVYRSVTIYDKIVQICSPTLGPVYVELVDDLSQLYMTDHCYGDMEYNRRLR